MVVLGIALALAQAASSAAPADDWRSMSTQELAARLLPPKVARRQATHEFSPASGDRPPTQVTFFTRPYPMPDGFCERDQYRVSLRSPAAIAESADIRRGDCPADGASGLAHVNPNAQLHVAQAKAAIRWLEGAIAEARGDRPLSFELNCVARARPNLCADGARAALARLAVENAVTVAGAFTCRPSETDLALRQEAGGGPLWRLHLARGTARPRLTMRWTAAPRS